MSVTESNGIRSDLVAYLQTIARPGIEVTQIADNANLFDEGALDSLAFVLVIQYLEQTHHINFSDSSIDPTKLSSVDGILRVIADTKK